jgi:hypothetical protein
MMDDAVRINREPSNFLSKMFFNRMSVSTSNSIQFDVVRGGRTVGAYVGKNEESIPIDRNLFNTKTLTPPLLSFSRSLTGADLEQRIPGKNPFEGGDGAAELTAQDQIDLVNITQRAEELQASQAIVSAAITLLDINGNALGDTVTFGRDANMTPTALAGTAKWGGSTSDPIGNLRTLSQLVQTYGDVMADVVVMRTSLYNTFAADTNVQAQLDVRRGPDTDKLTFEAMEMFATYRGMIDGLKVYTYDGVYKTADAGTLSYYIPANKVVVGSTNGEGTRYYGQIFSAQAGGMVTTDRYIDSWAEFDPDKIKLRVQSAPLLVPKRVDAFAVQKVVD